MHGTLLDKLKEKLNDLFNWCLEHRQEIAPIFHMTGATLVQSPDRYEKLSGVAFIFTGGLMNNLSLQKRKELFAEREGRTVDWCALVLNLVCFVFEVLKNLIGTIKKLK